MIYSYIPVHPPPLGSLRRPTARTLFPTPRAHPRARVQTHAPPPHTHTHSCARVDAARRGPSDDFTRFFSVDTTRADTG